MFRNARTSSFHGAVLPPGVVSGGQPLQTLPQSERLVFAEEAWASTCPTISRTLSCLSLFSLPGVRPNACSRCPFCCLTDVVAIACSHSVIFSPFLLPFCCSPDASVPPPRPIPPPWSLSCWLELHHPISLFLSTQDKSSKLVPSSYYILQSPARHARLVGLITFFFLLFAKSCNWQLP